MKNAIYNPFTKKLAMYNPTGTLVSCFSGAIAEEKVKRLDSSYDVAITINPKVKVQL